MGATTIHCPRMYLAIEFEFNIKSIKNYSFLLDWTSKDYGDWLWKYSSSRSINLELLNSAIISTSITKQGFGRDVDKLKMVSLTHKGKIFQSTKPIKRYGFHFKGLSDLETPLHSFTFFYFYFEFEADFYQLKRKY